MLIHGYDKDKVLVQADISIAQIVQRQIDPWRLDLFDPDPVIYETGGKTICFRRFTDVAFAYIETDGKVVVGIHNGNAPMCLLAEFDDCSCEWNRLEFSKFNVSEHSFAHHFQRYLAAGIKDSKSGNEKRSKQIYSCESASKVTLHGGKLRYEANQGVFGPVDLVVYTGRPTLWSDRENPVSCPLLYRGEMFGETAFPFTLPEEINWVFKALGEFSPAVVRRSLWHALKGKPVKHVEVVMDPEPHEKAQDRLFKLGLQYQGSKGERDVSYYRYMRGDVHYNLTMKRSGRSVLDHLHDTVQNVWSVHGLYCTGPNEIRGTRIAFSDLGHKTARPISALAHKWLSEEHPPKAGNSLDVYLGFEGSEPFSKRPEKFDSRHLMRFTATRARTVKNLPSPLPDEKKLGSGNNQPWFKTLCRIIDPTRALAA